MATMITREVANYTCMFVCSSRSTRSGFAHDVELFVNGIWEGKATCHYLNRTWECWTYQSVCKSVVYDILASIKKQIKEEVKYRNGWKRVDKKRQMVIDAEIEQNVCYRFYKELLESLR